MAQGRGELGWCLSNFAFDTIPVLYSSVKRSAGINDFRIGTGESAAVLLVLVVSPSRWQRGNESESRERLLKNRDSLFAQFASWHIQKATFPKLSASHIQICRTFCTVPPRRLHTAQSLQNQYAGRINFLCLIGSIAHCRGGHQPTRGQQPRHFTRPVCSHVYRLIAPPR